MLLAASYAGMGFGNAGVHLPHGMSYPVAGMVRDYLPPGYATGHPLVPHGVAVIVNAPAVFRFTAGSSPQRHLEAAAVLGADTEGAGSGGGRVTCWPAASSTSCGGSTFPTGCARSGTTPGTSPLSSRGPCPSTG